MARIRIITAFWVVSLRSLPTFDSCFFLDYFVYYFLLLFCLDFPIILNSFYCFTVNMLLLALWWSPNLSSYSGRAGSGSSTKESGIEFEFETESSNLLWCCSSSPRICATGVFLLLLSMLALLLIFSISFLPSSNCFYYFIRLIVCYSVIFSTNSSPS